MDILRSLVQNLVIIVILAMFMEMLLPAGEMRKYVKMVMGLLIVVAVVQAAGEMARWDFTWDLPSLTRKEDQAQVSGILEAGQKISGEQQQRAMEQYQQGLANQVRALAGINKEITVVGVEVEVHSRPGEPDFGQLKEIVLAVSKNQAEGGSGGGVVVEVEPVAVTVGGPGGSARGGETPGPPREDVAGLISTVANFYNLRPEQVKVVYR